MSDPVLLVTGGAGNLGQAVSRALAASGARLAIPLYKTDPEDALSALRTELGDRLHSFALDLTTQRGAQHAVDQVVEWGGRIDGVVHLVGGYRGGTPLADTPTELWDRMMDLNLKSAFLVARASIPHLVRGGGGTLVFVSSRAALQDRAGHAAYAVAKAGVITLAQAIAEEYRHQGVRANAVLPGTIDTEANRGAVPDTDRARWTPASEIARVVAFLAGPESAPVNGAAVPVYGLS